MMEIENVIKVKQEPICSNEDEADPLSNQGEEGQILSLNEAEQPKQSKDVSAAQTSTPPLYTQSHNSGAKWKMDKEKKQYNCKTCKFKFTSKAWLIKHERMHENMENKAKLYKCEICRKEFTQKIIYHDHMTAHSGQRPYVCDRCGMDFTWYRAFYRHQQSHKTGGKDFSCHLCHRKFNSNWNLSRHLKEIHLSQQIFKCNACGKQFEKKNLYLIHMKAHDREEREKKKQNGIVSEKVKQKHREFSKLVRTMMQTQSENNEKDANIEESVLSYEDLTTSELMENIAMDPEEDDTNVSYDGKLFRRVSKPQEETDTTETKVKEIQSQKINSDLDNTLENIIKSPVERNPKLKPHPCKCDICGKSVHNLDAHLRIHSGEKPFKCCLCDKDFAQREALKVHYRSHTGEKPFICSTCGKGFATRGLQQDHARAHRGDKPYHCDVCDARFSWRCALSRHKQLHSTGPKPHSCSVCTFECWRKHDLTKHEKTHLYDNHYQCDFQNCTATFTNKKHLVKHKKKHTASENSVSNLSRNNCHIRRLQQAEVDDSTVQIESKENHSTVIPEIEIKQEPVDTFVDDERHTPDWNTSDIPTMYVTSNDGQIETLTNNTTEDGEGTDPDSSKLCYVKGKRLYLNQDLQGMLSKKLKEKTMAETCMSDVKSSSDCLASKIQIKDRHGLRRQASHKTGVETLKHQRHQITISMNDVMGKKCQSTKNSDNSNSNMVCCEVCGKTLNISYYHIHVRKHMEEMAHTCKVCNKSFSRKTDLIVHSRVHTNIRPFQCNTCSKAFKVKSLLEDHVRSHDGIKPYVCNLCDASFAWRCAFHRHVKTHSVKKPFQCGVCGKDFGRRRDWAGHIEKKTCKFIKSIIYKCDECQAVFASLEILVYHNEKHHKKSSSSNVSDIHAESPVFLDTSSELAKELPPDSTSSPATEIEINSLVSTEQSATESDTVDERMKSNNTYLMERIGSNSEKTTISNAIHDRGDSEGTTEPENETNLPLSKDLLGNIKKEYVDSDSEFLSNVIESVAPVNDSSPTEHTDQSSNKYNSDPTNEKALPLNTDEFSFVNWTGKDLQIQPPNVNESPFISDVSEDSLKCKICGRGFVSSIGLKVHLRIHSKDAMDIYALHFRPDELITKSKRAKEERKLKYKCELCDKTFPFASGLRIHMMAHSGKLPYSCKTCGKRFPYLESVKSHMRVHTGERPFTCDVCGKSFAYRHNHDDHYRTHTGDKPHKCDRCDSAFTWKSALHRHHKTHSLETLEVCTICKAKFKNGGQLVRHMNRFHSSLV